MNLCEYNEKELLEYKDEFEQLEYGKLENNNELAFYRVLFNGKWSNSDIEANSKEGWIKVFIWNFDPYKEPIKTSLGFSTPDPYIIYTNDNPEVAYTKLYGNVIIFKLDRMTGKLIKKVYNET